MFSSSEAYFRRHHVSAYTRDAIAQLVRSNTDNPLDFLLRYFSLVARGQHVLSREFDYIAATPHNRVSFLRLAAVLLKNLDQAGISWWDICCMCMWLWISSNQARDSWLFEGNVPWFIEEAWWYSIFGSMLISWLSFLLVGTTPTKSVEVWFDTSQEGSPIFWVGEKLGSVVQQDKN